ncbi:alpha/beta hydrolase [Nocardioides sp. Kera G14]|uniref:alpha/beta hydrolase n=1 Tax=Nocardioides sp. Kera G14 TaxID=2884264 RepID=UPI001D107A8F|nr:alpha/beta hydrolase [Nocardioides sp. Kera G14]UDY22294.1 alpha/beta hydrolase [Nocardioides sp. Kera G14]
MSLAFTLRHGVLAALVANSVRPLRGGSATFAAGWPVSELAPQLLTAALLDTAQAAVRRRAGAPGLALASAAAAGLAWNIVQAERSRGVLERALAETLGEPVSLGRSDPRRLVRPFNFKDVAVRRIKDVSYGPAGKRNRLDVYVPAGDVPTGAPVLVQIHGGAWTIGNKEEQGRFLMNAMAARGWVCVAINYRLAPRDRWPAQIDDVHAALAWVKEHISEYGGDASHLVLTGGSAGGHLSSLAALTSAERGVPVAGCVPFYGVYDMAGEDEDPYTVGMRDRFLALRVFGETAVADDYKDASPIHRISPEAPDFFLLHGRNDSLVSVRQARAFAAALRKVSQRTVTFAELPGAQHAFDVFGSIRAHHAVDAVVRWLEWHRDIRVTAPRDPGNRPATSGNLR